MDGNGLVDTDFVTVTRYILESQKQHPEAHGELTQTITAIMTACKSISNAVRRAGITQIYGLAGNVNETGDDVKKLDKIADELFTNLLVSSMTTRILVSEEKNEAIIVSSEKRGSYIVCFDPLDGSSNIDCLGSIGTIFCILKGSHEEQVNPKEVLQSGRNIVCAGYALYGSATMLVLALGGKVNGFMLDPSIGEFILSDRDIQIPPRGSIYSINEGYEKYWESYVKKYVDAKKHPQTGEPYRARYIGSMVADIHRTLKYGGIFMYPGTIKAKQGKLRLLYECNPMSFIVEMAGGKSSNGNNSILDVTPTGIHQKQPFFAGSKEDVDDLLSLINE